MRGRPTRISSFDSCVDKLERQMAKINMPKYVEVYSNLAAGYVRVYTDKGEDWMAATYKMQFYAVHMWFGEQGTIPWLANELTSPNN